MTLLLVASTLQLSCSSTTEVQTAKGPRVHNLGPDFIEFWKSVKNKTPEAQVKAIKKDFFPKFPEFYGYKMKKWEKMAGDPDKEIKTELAAFPKIEEDFIKKTNEISKDLDST